MTSTKVAPVNDHKLLELFHAIALCDHKRVHSSLATMPELATLAIHTGASRERATDFFLEPIAHQVYSGDTPLHVASAAYDATLARELVALGADIDASNRRKATPLHYAADGATGSPLHAADQVATIDLLVASGARVNAVNANGVSALHRAVRSRRVPAVQALLRNGADVNLQNDNGSTPLHLAVQNTGRANSGSEAAVDAQRVIIETLLTFGALASVRDSHGKTALECAASTWVRELVEKLT